MTTNLTVPQAPVSDEELDQLIWGLERYGLYPRQLAALKELREVRKAKGEPAGWKLVPVEPTESMIISGFEAELREEFRDPEAWEVFEAMSGCEQAAYRAKWCWAAMIKAAPQIKGER